MRLRVWRAEDLDDVAFANSDPMLFEDERGDRVCLCPEPIAEEPHLHASALVPRSIPHRGGLVAGDEGLAGWRARV
jgi:hypothetical protein